MEEQTVSKRAGLDRNRIKYIAIAAMVIDHVAMLFLSPGIADAPPGRVALYAAMRSVGRLTGPLMIFFLTEGFVHTSSRRRYGVRLLLFALVSQIPYALACHNTLLTDDLNVGFTLFLIFLMLTALEQLEGRVARCAAVLGLIALSSFCDWGVIGPFMALMFHLHRDDRDAQVRYYCMISAILIVCSAFFLWRNGYHWYGELWQAGLFLAVPFLLLYNGEAGRKTAFNKWAFYAVYPLHLLILWFLKYRV